MNFTTLIEKKYLLKGNVFDFLVDYDAIVKSSILT